MPCFYPIPAYHEKGKLLQLYPAIGKQYSGSNLALPCGNCLGCRVMQSQGWATRIMHETQEHHTSKFVTLTYDEKHCPSDLTPRDLTLFLKRLREELRTGNKTLLGNAPESPYYRKLRYFAAGEYGDRTGRPHYHVVLFGLDFKDAYPYGKDLTQSPVLEEIWGMGHVRYGTVTHESAAYVALYTKKAVTGQPYCDANGEVRYAPFQRCSTHPGIGHDYAVRNQTDLRRGYTGAHTGIRPVPGYYRRVLERKSPLLAEEITQAIYEKGRDADPRYRSAEGLTARLVTAQQRHAQKIREHHPTY